MATRASISSSIQHVFIFNVDDSKTLQHSKVAANWLTAQFGDELLEGAVVWIRQPGDGSAHLSGLPSGVVTERFPGGSVSGVTGDLQDEGFTRQGSYTYSASQQRFQTSSQTDLSRLAPVGMQLWSRGNTTSPEPVDGGSSERPRTVPERPSSGIPVRGVEILRHVSYESGERLEANPQAPRGGVGTTTAVSRSGSQAGFSLLRTGDRPVGNLGYRAEWHGGDRARSGDERWNGISYYLPRDFDQGSNSRTFNDRILYQFTDEGSPMFSLHLDVNRGEMWVRRKLPNKDSNGNQQFEVLGRWNVVAERWYDIVFHAEWSTGNSGVFEVWVNGHQEVDYRGRTLAVRNSTASKWGVYGQPTKVYYDDVWMAEGSGTFIGR